MTVGDIIINPYVNSFCSRSNNEPHTVYATIVIGVVGRNVHTIDFNGYRHEFADAKYWKVIGHIDFFEEIAKCVPEWKEVSE